MSRKKGERVSETLLLDVDLDARPSLRYESPVPKTVRALVWKGGVPLGELHLPAATIVDPEEMSREAARQFASRLDAIRSEPLPALATSLATVTVAICTRDRTKDLENCLGSLARQIDAPPHEILVIDNAPLDDSTRQAVADHPNVRYVREDLPGVDFARNRALAEARGELIAFLDDDTIASRRWLRSIAEAFAEEPEAGLCSGPVFPAELLTEAQNLFEARGGFEKGLDRRVFGQTPPDEWSRGHWPIFAGVFTTGCNIAFRRRVLLDLGGYDPALGPGTPANGGDDHDIIYRVVAGGYRFVYDPRVLVRHRHRRETLGLRRQLESWGRGTVAYFWKVHGNEKERRAAVRRLLRWLFVLHLGRLWTSLRSPSETRFPPHLVLAELFGCIRGLWSYPLSERYVRRVRRAAERASATRNCPAS